MGSLDSTETGTSSLASIESGDISTLSDLLKLGMTLISFITAASALS